MPSRGPTRTLRPDSCRSAAPHRARYEPHHCTPTRPAPRPHLRLAVSLFSRATCVSGVTRPNAPHLPRRPSLPTPPSRLPLPARSSYAHLHTSWIPQSTRTPAPRRISSRHLHNYTRTPFPGRIYAQFACSPSRPRPCAAHLVHISTPAPLAQLPTHPRPPRI